MVSAVIYCSHVVYFGTNCTPFSPPFPLHPLPFPLLSLPFPLFPSLSSPSPALSLPCQVLTNIHGEPDWEPCFVVKDVDLPTGYYLGMSAATGDLAGT